MTILVTGATGNVGREVVEQLVKRGASVRALVRDTKKVTFAPEVEVIEGDLLNVDSLRKALKGVTTLFLLNGVVADEFTQALITLNLAKEEGVKRLVYLSVIHSDVYVDVPHFAGKYGVERLIESMDIDATILRPAYFINNDVTVFETISNYKIYPMPVGDKGLAMIDFRDIGEIAAIELVERNNSKAPIPSKTMNLVGPDTLTGSDIAQIWSDVFGEHIAYPGADPDAFESNMKQFMPSWMAYDMKLMSQRFISDGMRPMDGDVQRLQALLNRPLRSYKDFAKEIYQNQNQN